MNKVTISVDFVTVHHCNKFHSHILNVGDYTEGGGGDFVSNRPDIIVLKGCQRLQISQVPSQLQKYPSFEKERITFN